MYLYLADFALAILAAFGAEMLYSKTAESRNAWAGLTRILKWVAIACAVALFVPAIFAQVQIHVWNALSDSLDFVLLRLVLLRQPRPNRNVVRVS